MIRLSYPPHAMVWGLILASYLVFPIPSSGNDDLTFLLVAHSPSPYTPTYLANGKIGIPGSRFGIEPTECYVAGVYDHADGDVPRIAALPAWNGADVFKGKHWLSHAQGLQTPSNSNTNFVTGAGAFLQQFLFGYTGMRLTEEGLVRKYPSILPAGVTRLILKNLTVRGRKIDIEVPR